MSDVVKSAPKLQMSMDDIMTAAMALHKRMHRGETPILLTEEAGPFTTNILLEGSQLGASASQLSLWGVVPVSPHIARITALEADVARLLAENVRLAAANAVLQRGAEIIAAADVPSPLPAGTPGSVVGTETKHYTDGTSATGPGPLPNRSPGGAPECGNRPFPYRALTLKHQAIGMTCGI